MSVTINDFKPWGSWTVGKDSETWKDDPNMSMYIVDDSTGRAYWNQPEGVLRFKCFLLLTFGSAGQSLSLPINAAWRVLKVATFSHFWVSRGEKEYNFVGRLADFGKDLLRIVLTPIVLLGLALASLYGLFVSPRNGSKVYASIERAQYGDDGWRWAPCFQPDPKHHLLGGDPNSKRAI